MRRSFDAVARLATRCVQGLERPSSQTALYNAACAILLVVAAWVRFYDLDAPLLWLDEAIAGENASGGVADVLTNTATNSPSPILHPLLLHAVQGIDGSAWALRAASALGSVLTIAALLLLLPRVGMTRVAAFLAALMALTSVEAVRQAQDAREYSIDALFAVLTIVGCLAALRQRRITLLCCVLFLGPLLQYGLALFGVATLGALLLAHALGLRRPVAFTDWLRSGAWLAAPTVAFAAGCALTYALTLRHQGIASVGEEAYGFIPLDHLYEGGAGDIVALAKFAAEQTWGFLTYHIPDYIAAAGLVALVVAAALAAFGKARGRVIPALFGLGLAVALGAAALRLYPFGGARHTMYLSVIAFIAFGWGTHTILAILPPLWRRLGGAGAAAAIAAIGAVTLSGYAYGERGRAEVFLAALQGAGDDPIYVPFNSAPILRFYERHHPADYRYGESCPPRDRDGCTDAVMAGLLPLHEEGKRRVWAFSFVRDYVEGVIAGWWRGDQATYAVGTGTLHGFLIDDLDVVLADRLRILAAHDDLKAAGLALGEKFNAFWDSERHRMMYGKHPCRRIQTWGTFMLRVVPADRDSLAPERRQYGADNLDFEFDDQGQRFQGHCMAVADLPDYPISRIDVGQYNAGGKILWAQSFEAGVAGIARQVIEAAPEPIIEGDFNVHRHGRELAYVKEQCQPEDTREPFFLRATPVDAADLPPERREQGNMKLDFPFDVRGVQVMTTCFAARRLPDFPIAAIETGQGDPSGEPAWSGSARLR